jgi:hypothetical protein
MIDLLAIPVLMHLINKFGETRKQTLEFAGHQLGLQIQCPVTQRGAETTWSSRPDQNKTHRQTLHHSTYLSEP